MMGVRLLAFTAVQRRKSKKKYFRAKRAEANQESIKSMSEGETYALPIRCLGSSSSSKRSNQHLYIFV